jgi:hypothetical protein
LEVGYNSPFQFGRAGQRGLVLAGVVTGLARFWNAHTQVDDDVGDGQRLGWGHRDLIIALAARHSASRCWGTGVFITATALAVIFKLARARFGVAPKPHCKNVKSRDFH